MIFNSHICSDYQPIPSRNKVQRANKTFLFLIAFSLLTLVVFSFSSFFSRQTKLPLPTRELLTWDPNENKQVIDFNRANQGLAEFGTTPITYQQIEEALSAKESEIRELASPKNNGDEFPQLWYDPLNPQHNSITHKRLKQMGVDMEAAKKNFDWSDVNGFNALTPVRDQGRTGTCWAFSSKVVSETAWWIAGNDLVEFSPQVVADCIDLTCKGEHCNAENTAAIDSAHTKDVEICQFGDCHFYQFDNFGYCDSAPFPNKGCGVRNGWGGGAQIDAFRYYWHRGFVKMEDYPFRTCAGHDWEYRHRHLSTEERKKVCLDQARYCAWDESMTYPFSKCILGLPVSLPCDEKANKIVGKISGAFIVSVQNDEKIQQDRFNNGEKELYFQGEAPEVTMSEERMKDALLNVGPLAISIVSGPMHYYQGGILDLPPELCGSRGEGDHAVTIVGYGEENGVKYWKVQNSWGDLWGEGGFIRMVRGKNSCGIASDVQAAYV